MIRPTPETFSEAARWISQRRHPLLVPHVTPDGDALGSLAAMRLLLRAQGIESTAMLLDPLPARYESFTRFGPLLQWNADRADADLRDVDAIVLLDVCTYKQLRPMADWLRDSSLPKMAIDHHVTRDDLADVYLIDESAAANCLILYDWAAASGWPLDRETSEALFTGIAMDTGWFRHSNTDTRVFAASADMAGRGVPAHDVFQDLFLTETAGRIRLLGAALNNLELLADDRIAVISLPTESFAKAGATLSDTEDIVNEPMRIGSVVVSILIVDKGDGYIRIGFRSKDPHNESTPDINVAALAQNFGGGGHRRASGARLAGTLAEVRQAIVEKAKQVLEERSSPGL